MIPLAITFSSWIYIESKFNVDTKVIVADFTRNKDLYEELAHHIEGLDIGILGECQLNVLEMDIDEYIHATEGQCISVV